MLRIPLSEDCSSNMFMGFLDTMRRSRIFLSVLP